MALAETPATLHIWVNVKDSKAETEKPEYAAYVSLEFTREAWLMVPKVDDRFVFHHSDPSVTETYSARVETIEWHMAPNVSALQKLVIRLRRDSLTIDTPFAAYPLRNSDAITKFLESDGWVLKEK
jgi:hypothetical protein